MLDALLMAIDKPHYLEKLDVRIPKWNMDNLNDRNCPFCSNENEAMLIRPDRLPVAFCYKCGCWYVAQLPSALEIKKLYDGYYHTHRSANLTEKGASQMLENARRASENNWQLQTLAQLLNGLRGKRILEVGCGLGNFLLMARSAGAEVIGCDLSPEACDFTNNRLGITVHQSELSSCMTAIGDVDAVVMRDLIEHPVEPLIDIQAACTILKIGGLLLLHTPNGGEAGTTVETAKKWVGFRVDLEHLQYISPHTVNWLSRKLGLRIERLGAFGFPGLKGIDKLPNSKSVMVSSTRQFLKKVPGMHRIVKTFRVLKNEMTGENRDPRLGTYHLFVIFRKI
jgi:2-polyprenyl-3-methyl-5-hydroxy-6-metoxy-1,4-benzoquinol methylase